MSTPRRRPWAREVELNSLRMREPLLGEAERNYALIDDEALKAQLAYEIAMTRGAELTLAYKNVVLVLAGQRRRRKRGREQLQDETCVIFLVRRKWDKKGKTRDADAQALPSALLTYVDWQGQRLLVAVPTDVQAASHHAAVRPQGMTGICIRRTGHVDECGAVTVGLGDDFAWGMSALHVLTPHYTVQGTQAVADSRVEFARGSPQLPGSPLIGTTSNRGGRLVPAPNLSLDAQLFKAHDPQALRQMLAELPLSRTEIFVASHARFNQLFFVSPRPVIEIMVPKNRLGLQQARGRVFAAFSSMATHSLVLPYGALNGILNVAHQQLIELDVLGGQTTLNGDSGCAVVLWRQDGSVTLLGMHIAAAGSRAHVIPAWLLFPGSAGAGAAAADGEPSGP